MSGYPVIEGAVDAIVQGDIASGIADSGNPVKVGGVVKTSPAASLDGQRKDLWSGKFGAVVVASDGGTDAGGDGRFVGYLSPGMTGASSGSPLLTAIALYNPTAAGFDRARTPTIFKTATLTASGSNAVWTPQSGKKFRLMGYIIEATENSSLSAGAVNTFSWLDAAAAIGLIHSDFMPTTAVTTGLIGYNSGVVQLGNGYLSTVANNVLNLSIGTTLATGAVRVNVWGTEE